jgi:hypothetical protein
MMNAADPNANPNSGAFDNSSIAHVRVIDAVARFAQHLPYRIRCSDDLDRGLVWAPRGVALLHHEIAPDPPGWRTSLRFDMDCPCDRRPHAKLGFCSRAATFWRDAGLPEPSFIVKNPDNGHAHYVYLLAGWIRIDGKNGAELAAVRYLSAIERAYTRALRADPGYAGLMHHNPFSARYQTTAGRDDPYTLSELAARVTLGSSPRRQAPEIRTDGRNVETFDRLRFWAYANVAEWRCGAFEDWVAVVNARALEIAAVVRGAHPTAGHPFTDAEALDTAKSVATWVWLRYDGASLTLAKTRAAARQAYDRKYALTARRARGCVPRETYLAEAQRRRTQACKLRAMGLAVDEIARRLGAGVRSVYRWIAELRSVPRPSAPSDFAGVSARSLSVGSSSFVGRSSAGRAFSVVSDVASDKRCAPDAFIADSGDVLAQGFIDGADDRVQPHLQPEAERAFVMRPERVAGESVIGYIRRRVAQIVAGGKLDRQPP